MTLGAGRGASVPAGVFEKGWCHGCAEVLLDVDGTIDRSHVERRLVDRHARTEALLADLQAWSPSGWSMSDGGAMPIHEDLMTRFEVPRQTPPWKHLIEDGNVSGRIEPRGLWIIGANGRVDVTFPDRRSLLRDRADSFEEPDRQVASILARRNQSRLTRDVLAQTLS